MPGLQASIYGLVRGLSPSQAGIGTEQEAALNERGEQIVAAGGLPLQELVRQGNSFQGLAGTAVAALIVEPTTVALLTLWNGEADGGKAYVIDSIQAIQVGAPATLGSFGLRASVTFDRAAAPTTNLLTPKALTGSKYAGNALLATGQTVINDGWFPVGNSVNTAVASLPGCQVDAPVAGGLIVRPGRQLNIHVVGSSASLTMLAGVRWHEIAMGAR